MGSMRAARRAGTRVATRAMTPSTSGTAMNVGASIACTSKSRRLHEPRGDRGTDEPDHDADEHHRQAVPHHEPEHMARRRPERHADGELARALRTRYAITP